MKPLVKILYEDQQAEDTSNFGPHVPVLRCVLDRLDWPEARYFELQRYLSGQPKKGDKKLLAACRNAREARNFRHVFAVFDADKVRSIESLGLSPGACKQQVRSAIQSSSPYGAQLRVVLLERNLETIVAAVQRCRALPQTGKLKLPERDAVLASIAWRAEAAPVRASCKRSPRFSISSTASRRWSARISPHRSVDLLPSKR